MFQRASESQRLRQRQIEQLLQLNQGISQVPGDQSKWDMNVQCQQGVWLVFRVDLPPRFPELPPHVQLLRHNNAQASGVQHPWLNQQQYVVGHPGLQKWSPHTNVGKYVSEICSEFQRNPPQFIFGQQMHPYGSSPQSQPSQTQSGVYNPYASYVSGQQQQPPQPQPQGYGENPKEAEDLVPFKIPSAFPSLAQLSTEELKNLYTNQESFDAWYTTLEAGQELETLRQDACTSTLEQAKKNLEKEEPLDSLKEEILSMRDLLKVKKSIFEEKIAKQQGIVNGYTPSAMFFKLSEKASEVDDQSEELASEFTRGTSDITLADFTRDFKKARVLYHTRQAKKDRFSKLYNLR